MTSYFDHFIVTKLISSYITDSLIIMVCVIALWMVISRYQFVIPSRFQSVMEIIIEHWSTVVKENLGEETDYYILPLSALFMFILGINLLGFFTYTFPPTTHVTLTFGMAFGVWIGVISFGFYRFRSSFFSMSMPVGAPLGMSPLLVPIEIASNVLQLALLFCEGAHFWVWCTVILLLWATPFLSILLSNMQCTLIWRV